MFDYEKHFERYRGENDLDLKLSLEMPAGYEAASGTFDLESKTVFVNAALLNGSPDYEKAFYLFHELRHASQYLCPGQFGDAVRRSLRYVVGYDGTCYKIVDGIYYRCRLEGGEERFTDIYLGQPHEIDANAYAYEQARNVCGDSDGLRKLYEFWLPRQPLPDEVYDSVYASIDKMIQAETQA